MDTHKALDPVTISEIANTVVDAFITILNAIEGHPFAALILLLGLIGLVLWSWRPRKLGASVSTVPAPPGTVINNSLHVGQDLEKGRSLPAGAGRGEHRIDDVLPQEWQRVPRVISLKQTLPSGMLRNRRAERLAPIRASVRAGRWRQRRKER